MRLGHHCRAPPLAVQPSPAPTIRHGGEARRVGAGARRWADLQASVTSTGPVCGQTDPGGWGEIVVGATQSADRSFSIFLGFLFAFASLRLLLASFDEQQQQQQRALFM